MKKIRNWEKGHSNDNGRSKQVIMLRGKRKKQKEKEKTKSPSLERVERERIKNDGEEEKKKGEKKRKKKRNKFHQRISVFQQRKRHVLPLTPGGPRMRLLRMPHHNSFPPDFSSCLCLYLSGSVCLAVSVSVCVSVYLCAWPNAFTYCLIGVMA